MEEIEYRKFVKLLTRTGWSAQTVVSLTLSFLSLKDRKDFYNFLVNAADEDDRLIRSQYNFPSK